MGKLIPNLDAFIKGLRKEPAEVKRLFSITVQHTIILLHEEITARTPVHTGDTLANYIWSMDAPIEQHVDPIPDGQIYGTNHMALGVEPRRRSNQDVATATLAGLSYENPFRRYYLTNSSEAVEGLEYGQLPSGTQFTPRSPNGMFEVSLNHVYSLLEAGYI